MTYKLFKMVLFLVLSSLLFSCGGKQIFTGKFGVEPINPQPGQSITVYYSADSSKLADAQTINMIAYPYSISADTVFEKKMIKEGDFWIAQMTIPESSRGIVFKFTNNKLFDSNEGRGFVIFLRDKDGNFIAGSKAGFAASIDGWGIDAEIKNNKKEIEKYFNEEFANNPEIKKAYLDSYLGFIFRKNNLKSKSEVKSELNKLLKDDNKSENDYLILFKWFSRLQMDKSADSVATDGLKKFPQGQLSKSVIMQKFNKQNDIKKKMQIIKNFEKNYSNDKFAKKFYNSILYNYARTAFYDEAYKFMIQFEDKISPSYFSYAVNRMLANQFNQSKIEKLFNISINKDRSELEKDISEEKPKTTTKREYIQKLNYYLGRDLMGLGKFYYSNKKYEKATPLLKEGIEKTKKIISHPETNEIYINALFKSGKYDEVLNTAEKFIEDGENTEKMIELFKKSFIKKNGSDKGFSEFLAKFSSRAKKQIEAELKKEIKNIPAPEFTLMDLHGRKVSLKDYRGKTVVLDFWATWCGPCKSSFPGMQKAVNYYKNDKNVKFLFINTWEKDKNKLANAKLFISQNGYPFDVLLDLQDKVVSDYMVSGIPTKYVIDKNGNIRFEKVGFSGNADKMVEEIKTMIALIK